MTAMEPANESFRNLLPENKPASGEKTGKVYDMLVIGGGPGGYTAALYASRAGLKTLVLEKLSPGGQMAQTAHIDNYPGFEEGIDGFSLGPTASGCGRSRWRFAR